jgi:subtilisin family serine protease
MNAKAVVLLLAVLLGASTEGVQAQHNPRHSRPRPQAAKTPQPEIVPGFVVVKIHSTATARSLAEPRASTGLASLDAKLQRFGATGVQKMFRHKPIHPGSGIPDISRILRVRIPERMNPVMVALALERDPNVEYAEPVYLRRPLEVPNDPMYSQQHHLPQIHAPEAWDVQKGDTSVIIAIIDTGIDYDHEDLAANVWTNEEEASGVAGVDDDGNGYVDDIHGWDFGNDDADPTDPSVSAGGGHGTHCAGIASAATNNQTGVAGVSWHCKVMAVKTSPDEDLEYIYYGFEGIVYAADNGADVISNSWGGSGYSQMEEEVIAYAHSKGAIVVCAAGNDNIDGPDYPSSYRNAVSVAAVRVDDFKTGYSSFGPAVDIAAPGGDVGAMILSTIPDNSYQAWSGTSMATPVVSGVCGLVKSHHPDWTNDQIIRQVLLSADDIYPLNPSYRHRLGHGRVNAFRAVTATSLEEPDARLSLLSLMVSDSLYGNDNSVLERGETIQLRCGIQNHSIGGTSGTTLRLSCASAGVEILDGTVSPGYFPADTTLHLDFSIRVTDTALAHVADFVLRLETAQGYSRDEQFELTIGTTPLLLVDDDRPTWMLPDVELSYRDILNKQNLSYGYWDVQQHGFPRPETLLKFPVVIMCSVWLGNFANNEPETAVEGYLNGGNSLFICGQDIAELYCEVIGTEPARAFVRDYLHAEYIAGDSESQEVKGVEGDPISHDMSFHIWQPGYRSDWQGSDVIAPAPGASTVFTYSDGRAGGVKYSGEHKVVYLAFGLEAVDSYETTQIGDPSAIRTGLLMRTIEWLNLLEHDPRKDVMRTDTMLTVSVQLGGSVQDFQTPTLSWRVAGESAFTSVPMTDLGQRRYSVEIAAPDSGDTIEYYLQTTHPYYTWTSPIEAPATLHRYPVPAQIVVNTTTMDLGLIKGDADRRDSSFLVHNLGGVEDSLYVSIDYITVSPESAMTVSPTAFALGPDSSRSITVSVFPRLLRATTYNAIVQVDSRTSSGTRHFEKTIKFTIDTTTAVIDDGVLPQSYALHQNFPNPFNPSTMIEYALPEASFVTLTVYNVLGEEVATLASGDHAPGTFEVRWEVSGMPSGVYFYRLTAGDFVQTKKMVLMR